MYLLDTDVLSDLMKPLASANLEARLSRVSSDQQFTSSITLGELVYGIFRLVGRRRETLTRLMEAMLIGLPVLPFDAIAARRYGEIRAGLDRAGTPIGDADVRIAAIALVNGLTVVTGNVRHFSRVPELPVENWFQP